MKRHSFLATVVIGGSILLVGCSEDRGYQDLSRYMDEVRTRPKGVIDPLPAFNTYEAFAYSASGERSPFDRPVKVEVARKHQVFSDIKPDLDRVKQYLENFAFDSFTMVGTLSDESRYYALLAADGGVYKVQVGDYLGRNHGRIIGITDAEIQIVEIVSSGGENWVERPRTLLLKGS